MCVNRFVAAFAVALTAVVSHARETPIYEGRLASPLNANQQMITNLPSAFWEGHGVGGVDTNAVKALINSETGGTNAVKTAVQPGAATNIAEAVVGAWTPAAISDGTNRIDAARNFSTVEFRNQWSVTGAPEPQNPDPYEVWYSGGISWDEEIEPNRWVIGFSLYTELFGMGEYHWVPWGDEDMKGDIYNPNATLLYLPDNAHTPTTRLWPVTTRLATTNELPTAAQKSAWDAKASPEQLATVTNRLDYMEGYMAGQRVRVSVTNYYGNSSGELPRLRIEEFVTATNEVGGVATETNYWQTVWDEQNKYTNFLSEAKAAIAAMTNDLYQTYYSLLQQRLATRAPRAWGTLTSAGEAAPPDTVWHSAPSTVFAGGTEYAHAVVGSGVIGVLSSVGAPVYTDGETGRFHFTTDDRLFYFGMNVASRYELPCATDGISVTAVGGAHMVDLTYNVTMSGKPILYYKPNLTTNVWETLTDSTGAAVPGASVYASWDQSPPAGSEICTVNCGAGLSGFFKAGIEYAGTSKFETNMMADFGGGILATNITSHQTQPIEPVISTNGIIWRLKQ